MTSFSVTLDVPAAPEDLFRYLAEPANRPQWQSSLKAVADVDPGEPRAGQQWRDVTKVGFQPHLRWTEVTPFRTLSEVGTWRGVEGVLTLRFVKVGSGTRLTAEGTVTGSGAFSVAASLAGRLAPGAVKADLLHAAELVAGRGP